MRRWAWAGAHRLVAYGFASQRLRTKLQAQHVKTKYSTANAQKECPFFPRAPSLAPQPACARKNLNSPRPICPFSGGANYEGDCEGRIGALVRLGGGDWCFLKVVRHRPHQGLGKSRHAPREWRVLQIRSPWRTPEHEFSNLLLTAICVAGLVYFKLRSPSRDLR